MTAGRIDITRRALERTVTAVAAERLGVRGSLVSVKLDDHRGDLAVSITSPLGVGRASAGLLTRGADARESIARDVTTLTGSTVGTITLRLTRAITITERRVQ